MIDVLHVLLLYSQICTSAKYLKCRNLWLYYVADDSTCCMCLYLQNSQTKCDQNYSGIGQNFYQCMYMYILVCSFWKLRILHIKQHFNIFETLGAYILLASTDVAHSQQLVFSHHEMQTKCCQVKDKFGRHFQHLGSLVHFEQERVRLLFCVW